MAISKYDPKTGKYYNEKGQVVKVETPLAKVYREQTPENQQAIKDWIKAQGGAADIGMAMSALGLNKSGGGNSGRSSGGGGSGGETYTPERPSLRSVAELAELFGGITYDQDAIRSIFDKATRKEYDMLNKEYAMTENKFYDKLFGTGMTALDTIRKANAQAVATGASRGIQAANELSAILGLEQSSIADATKLAQERNLLKDKEAAAIAENIVNALKYANDIKQALGAISSNIYAADVQFDVGQMDYAARLDQAEKTLQGMLEQAGATRYSADKGKESSDNNALMNLIGNIFNAITNKETQLGVADKNYEGDKYIADQNLAGQLANINAQKSSYNYSGGGANSSNAMFKYSTPTEAMQANDFLSFLMFFPNLDLETVKKLFDDARKGSAAATQKIEEQRINSLGTNSLVRPSLSEQIRALIDLYQ